MMAGVPRRLVILFAALVLPVAVGACGGSSSSAACGQEVHEALDSRSTQHVFPGSAEPTYATDPPTSGPHRVGAGPGPVSAQPIDRPLQVHLLEDGLVLVQYRDPSSRAAAERLGSAQVTVAPNPSLPAPVVVTAWTFKMSCSRVDAGAVRAFVKAHAGKGAGHA